jgi:hypothetical protein
MKKYDLLFRLNIFIINIVAKLISFSRLFSYLKIKKILKKNELLKSARTSDTCYILGLGPSLEQVDLSKINGDTIAVNRFHLFSRADSIIPTFVCMVDRDFFVGEAKQSFIDSMAKFPSSNYLLNGKYFKEIEKVVSNKDNKYYACMWNGALSNKTKVDFTRLLPSFGNVLIVSIAFAIFLGYTNIIILGADYDLFANRRTNHCYFENTNKRKKMSNELFSYAFVSDTHYELQKMSTKLGIKILNGTKNSLLDAYEFDEDTIKSLYY